MKKLIILISLFFLNIGYTFSQEEKASTPLESYSRANSFKIGETIGVNILLAPSELLEKPTIASKEVEESLLNGLDGLGFGTTFNFGIYGKYFVSENFDFGANFEYSAWNSENSCNCIDEIYRSDNSLSLIHIGLFSEYFIWNNLYATAELGLNLFGVEVSENSKRGNIDYEESFNRIGLGLGIGYEFALSDNLGLSISGKLTSPNIVTTNSEKSLIHSDIKQNEPSLLIMSLSFSLLYKL